MIKKYQNSPYTPQQLKMYIAYKSMLNNSSIPKSSAKCKFPKANQHVSRQVKCCLRVRHKVTKRITDCIFFFDLRRDDEIQVVTSFASEEIIHYSDIPIISSYLTRYLLYRSRFNFRISCEKNEKPDKYKFIGYAEFIPY